MTTYNTYQEAKIANPDSDISVAMSGVFAASDCVSNIALSGCVQGWNKCNPADHCMTVEKFLRGGGEFKFGDLVVDLSGVVSKITVEWIVNESISEVDRKYLILRAAALEEKKPRTKVEYVKCEFSHAWEAVKAFEDGEVFHTHFMTDGWVIIEHVQQVIPNLQVEKLYRRIETPITEREAFVEAAIECIDDYSSDDPNYFKQWFESMYDSGKFKLVN